MNNRVAQVLIMLFGFVALNAVAQKPSAVCTVNVSTPLPGDNVGRDGKVRGTAKIPAGTYLWVLSHIKDLTEEWWPQAGRPASIGSKMQKQRTIHRLASLLRLMGVRQ